MTERDLICSWKIERHLRNLVIVAGAIAALLAVLALRALV